MSFPQLRVRSGYSYRDCYGRIPDIINRLKELGCGSAGMVDWGTWGHAKFEQACKKAGIQAMFGMEIPINDGSEDGFKPRAWVLAKDTRKFYNLTTEVFQRGFISAERLGVAEGVIRFVGGAVDAAWKSPDSFDYVDINPSSLLHAASLVKFAKEHKKPMVITCYNDMPSEADKRYAYAWEVRESVGHRHLDDEKVLWEELKFVMTLEEFEGAIQNTISVAKSLEGISLQKAPLIHLDGDLVALCREGQKSRLKRGHIKEWTQEYEDRLLEELNQIQMKEFDSYFLVVSDLVRYAKTKMLVGPARGSSAGSLVCFLIGITEVDPIPHDLLFARFIDVSRSDLPDIDIDFADNKRHLVFEYLQEKYGHEYVSKMGNINTLKPLSVMAQVGKKFNVPINETNGIRNALIDYSSGDARYGHGLEDTMKTTEPGQRFERNRPIEADCFSVLELHPSHTGVHAAAILVCNEKISDFCTVNAEGVPHIDKPDSEYLNLLKIDALGLTTLGIIEDTGVVTAEQLYSLPLDDKAALDVINAGKVSDIFQFSGRALQMVCKAVHVDEFRKIDHITALARPGPLASGMMQLYSRRASGQDPVTYDFPVMEKILSNTFGVILYQEQIMALVREVGQFDWAQTSVVRKAMSGRKGEEFFNQLRDNFVAGAVPQGYSEADALKIWEALVSYGSWAFNASHSVSYAIISYWCCWIKAHYPLEWAAANLRSAKDETQTIEILREMAREGVQYTAFDPHLSGMNWEVRERPDGSRILVGGVMNLKGFGPAKAAAFVQKREAGKLTEKDWSSIEKAEVQFSDLTETQTKWGHFYENPALIGVYGEDIKQIADCQDGKESVFICKLKKKILGDENEAVRIKKRGGKRFDGPSEFLDMHVVDDSLSAVMTLRIRPENFVTFGREIYENWPKDSWMLVRGRKLNGIGMIIVKKCKRLDE